MGEALIKVLSSVHKIFRLFLIRRIGHFEIFGYVVWFIKL